MRFFFLFFLFSLFLVNFVAAVGVSPAKYEVEFSPGFETDLRFLVNNHLSEDIHVNIGVQGSLAEYVTISENKLFTPSDGLTEFFVHLKLPENISTPGKNIIKITIVEDVGGSGISARTGVIPIIVVHVPYPGRYAEIASFIAGGDKGGVNEGQNTSAEFTIINRGKEDLLDTSAAVTLSQEDNLFVEKVFDNIDIPVGMSNRETFGMVTDDLPAGSYTARLEYNYDNITRVSKKTFLVGYLDVDATNLPKTVQKHGITGFPFRVLNRWGEQVKVSGALEVNGKHTDRTADVSLQPFGSHNVKVYLDTSALELGNHTGFVILEFEREKKSGDSNDPLNRKLTKRIPVNFTLVEPYDAAPVVEERPSLLSNTTALYGILLTLLLLLGAAGVILFQTLHKSQSKK